MSVVRSRSQLPTGHGEVLTDPAFGSWAELVTRAPAVVESWDCDVAGRPVATLRDEARAEIVEVAAAYTRELGLETGATDPTHVVVTGHQPDLFHPGIWVKDFLLHGLAAQTGAAAIDLVVDSDTFDSVELVTPCVDPDVRVCSHPLAASEEACYACAPAPSEADVRAWCAAGAEALATLPAPAVARHFASYCDSLKESLGRASDLASTLVAARRLYEQPSGTAYLEQPVTRMSRTRAFRTFLAHVVSDAERFACDHNSELQAFRAATKTRSTAQPFPDLVFDDDGVELPVWAIGDRRRRVFARKEGSSTELHVEGEPLVLVPADFEGAVEMLGTCDVTLAPRALLLTLFIRMLVADVFIHGVGGARYDTVTDGLARRYFGIELPPYVTASMTMYLPLGIPLVSEQEVADARDAVHRMEHNPDAFLGEVSFENAQEQEEAARLAAMKSDLVAAIKAPGADKRVLGARIREVNEAMGGLLEPMAFELRERLERLEAERRVSSVLTDRSYPFCLWSPLEVQDKVM
jgi:hypothetical protein